MRLLMMLLLVIGQVHDAGEVLAEADRINDGEAQPARRRRREQPQNDVVHCGHSVFTATAVRGLEQNGTFSRILEQQRKKKISRVWERQPLVLGKGFDHFVYDHVKPAELHGVCKPFRRNPVLPVTRFPFWKQPGCGIVRRANAFVNRPNAPLPLSLKLAPFAFGLGLKRRSFCSVSVVQLR